MAELNWNEAQGLIGEWRVKLKLINVFMEVENGLHEQLNKM